MGAANMALPPGGVSTLLRCSFTSLFLCALVVVFMNTEIPGHAKAKEELLPRRLETSQQQAEAKLAASEMNLAKIEQSSRIMLKKAERASDVEMSKTRTPDTFF